MKNIIIAITLLTCVSAHGQFIQRRKAFIATDSVNTPVINHSGAVTINNGIVMIDTPYYAYYTKEYVQMTNGASNAVILQPHATNNSFYFNSLRDIAAGSNLLVLNDSGTNVITIKGNGNMEYAGNINLAAGKEFTIDGTSVSGLAPAYGEMYFIENSSYLTETSTYKALTGLSDGEFEKTELVGDSAIKILSGGSGKYKVTWKIDYAISTSGFGILYVKIYIGNTAVDKTFGRNVRSYEDLSTIYGQGIINLNEDDIIKLRYKTSETGTTNFTIENASIIIERIDD